MDIIEYVKENLDKFKNFYDIIRAIDPVKKKIIFVEDGKVIESEATCYGFWGKGSFCNNCSSMRAYLNDDTFVKIEKSEEKIFLVTSTAVIFNNNKYVIEILKDITTIGSIAGELISEMNEKIIKDELTRIYNRRYINERLPVDITNSILRGTEISIIMADIDYFKDVNDTYGHLVGDKVLKDFAHIILNSIRKDVDWVARYGGDEFIIVLNNTSLDNAYKVAEKIRKVIEIATFKCEEISLRITSSFGVYESKNNVIGPNELIEKVDRNLFEAKKEGRNRTTASL